MVGNILVFPNHPPWMQSVSFAQRSSGSALESLRNRPRTCAELKSDLLLCLAVISLLEHVAQASGRATIDHKIKHQLVRIDAMHSKSLDGLKFFNELLACLCCFILVL